MEKFVIELVRDTQVISFQEFSSVKDARAELNKKMANRFFHRLALPDITGYLADDEARYDRQCKLLGIDNVFA